MKSLLFGIGALLVAPSVFSAPAMTFSKSVKTVKEHWVTTKLQGVAAGSWPSSPVQLKDGRIFFNNGAIEQISGSTATTLNYNQSDCPSMNGAFGLEATSDDQLVIAFSPSDISSDKPYPVLGMVDPDTGTCRVLAYSLPGTSEEVALSSDHQDNFYYVVASGGIDTFQFYKYSEKSGTKKLFSFIGNMPDDIAVDSKGNLYASWYSKVDAQYHNQVTVWDVQTSKNRVYAGNGQSGKSPDGTLAVNAALGNTYGIAIDTEDNLYIAQEGSEEIISRIDAKTGKIYHFAGDGRGWYWFSTSLSKLTGMNPRGISITPSGNILYTDIQADKGLFSDIRMIDMKSSVPSLHF